MTFLNKSYSDRAQCIKVNILHQRKKRIIVRKLTLFLLNCDNLDVFGEQTNASQPHINTMVRHLFVK